MRLLFSSGARVTFEPTRITSPTPISVEKKGDDLVVTSRARFGGGISSSVASIGGVRCVTTNISSCCGGTVFSGNGNLTIDGVPYIVNGVMTEHAKKERDDVEKEDDNHKKTWEMDVPVFDEIKLTGSGAAIVDPKVLSTADLKIDLTGSGDVKVMSVAKFNRVAVALIGSGDVNLGDSEVGNAYINLMGSGDIKHFTVTENGTLRLMGSGDISCRKGPKAEISKRCHGSGDIKVT